jgi:hypothetical protein
VLIISLRNSGILKQLVHIVITVLYTVNPIHCDFSEETGCSRVTCFE